MTFFPNADQRDKIYLRQNNLPKVLQNQDLVSRRADALRCGM